MGVQVFAGLRVGVRTSGSWMDGKAAFWCVLFVAFVVVRGATP